MEEEIQNEFQELQKLETAGETLDDVQQSRLSVLKMLDEAEKTATQKSKDLDSALAQKEHFRTKFEEKEVEIDGLKKSKPIPSVERPTVNTVEIIKAGKKLEQYNNEEIDYISRFTGKENPTPDEILKVAEDPYVKAGINGVREKLEKEKELNPSTRQTEVEKPKGTMEKLAEIKKGNPFVITEEREKLDAEAGLWKSPQVRPVNKRIPLSNG